VIRAVVVSIVLALAVAPAAAEHMVYYRYVVLGFVKDAQGTLVRGRPVDVIRDKTGLTYSGKTDEQGFFVLVVRLGDESVGETLTLRVGRTTTKITTRFDPTNHTDDRGTRVDLEDTKFVERTTAFRPTLARFVRNERH
jgi:hypothetical protein